MVGMYIIYLGLISMSVVILLLLAVYSWQRQGAPGAKPFAWMMLLLAGFAIFNGLIVVNGSARGTLIAGRLGYVAVVQIPVAWLVFVASFMQRTAWLTWRRLIWFWPIPLITLLAAWSDPLLPLIWSTYQVVEIGPLLLLDVRFGPLLWLYTGYTYLAFVVGGAVLLHQARRASLVYQRQVIVTLTALLISLIINALYLSRQPLLPHVDFTPLSFTLSGIVMAWGLFRYRLFAWGPVARDLLIEKMQEGVLVLDREGYIVDTNPAARFILGLTAERQMNVPVQALLPEWPRVLSTLTAAPHTLVEMSYLVGDVMRQFEVSVSALPDAADDVSRWLVILHDITGRKQVEAQLRQRARELESLASVSELMRAAKTLDAFLPMALAQAADVLGTAFTSVYLLRPGTDMLELTAAYPPGFPTVGMRHRLGEGITGYVAATGEAYITENVTEDARACLLPEERAIAAATALRSQMSLPLCVQDAVLGVLHVGLAEKRPFHPDEVRLATAVADILAGAVDRFLIVAGLEQEVAARTVEIRAEQEKQEIILNNVQDAIVLYDLNMVVDYVNQEFARLTGYSAAEVCGRATLTEWMTYLTEQDARNLQATLVDNRIWQAELSLCDRHGRVYDAAVVVAPVHDAQGQLAGYVSSHRDITWRKELEQARNKFMTNISHQLRTPVTNVKLYADLLQMTPTEAKQTHYMEVLLQQVARLEHLVQDIIEMTALDSGAGARVWSVVPWSLVLEAVQVQFATAAERAGVQLLALPLPPNLPAVYGDDQRLVQALAELVDNAVEFTPFGGVVTLAVATAVAANRLWLTVTVQDNGPGIPPDEQAHIFDRFYRGRLAASGQVPGAGLGLSIVKAIIEAHHGHVTVQSVADEGTLFTCWLPIAPTPGAGNR